MALLTPIEFSAADKLNLLQRLDQFRQWRSLDDRRYCLVCSGLMEGHDILIVGGTRGTGPLRAICPTHGCHSIPMDWILPTDEMLAQSATAQSVSLKMKAGGASREKLGARLRKLATHFRRAA